MFQLYHNVKLLYFKSLNRIYLFKRNTYVCTPIVMLHLYIMLLHRYSHQNNRITLPAISTWKRTYQIQNNYPLTIFQSHSPRLQRNAANKPCQNKFPELLQHCQYPFFSHRFVSEKHFRESADFTRTQLRRWVFCLDHRQLAIGTSFSHSPFPFELAKFSQEPRPGSILAWRLDQLVGGLRTISICLSRNHGDHGNHNFPHPWPPLPLFLCNFNRTRSRRGDPPSLSTFCHCVSRRTIPSLSRLHHFENLATT